MNKPLTTNEMQILDNTGHITISWSPGIQQEIDHAEEIFDDYVGERGYSAFRVQGENQQGARLTEFDPSAARLMLVPQLKGG